MRSSDANGNKNNKRTRFIDLNEDILLMILEQMKLYDLVSLNEAQRELSFIIESVLKHKFARTMVVFQLPKENQKSTYFENRELIILHNANISHSSEFLMRFGHLISNLRINEPSVFAANELRRLFHLINFYCSETLTKMHMLFYQYRDIFKQIEKPFKNVNTLLLSQALDNFGNENFTFPEIFPALRELEFKYFDPTKELSWSDQTFPNLVNLNISMGFNNESIKNFKRIIKSNPQIQKLEFTNLYRPENSHKLLRFLSEHLPDLEYLRYIGRKYRKGVNDTNVPIHFANLKTLILEFDNYDVPPNTTFDQLEELVTGENQLHKNEWIKLVQNQKTLRKITINQPIYDADVMQMVNADSNLVEIIYKCGCEYDRKRERLTLDEFPRCSANAKTTSIIQLITRCESLQKLYLHSGWAATNSVFNKLQNQLPNGWTITRNTNYTVSSSYDYVFFDRN